MKKYTGGILQSMLSFTIVLFAHRSNYSFYRKRFLSLVFEAFLLDLLCCYTTLSANQRLTAGSYTADIRRPSISKRYKGIKEGISRNSQFPATGTH